MALTLYEAAKLSQNPLTAGVLKAFATSDQFMTVVPMEPKAGSAEEYDREKALPTVEFVDPGTDTISESHATFDKVIAPMRAITSDVDVSLFSEEQQEDTNRQRAVQVSKKMKALGRTLGQKAWTGKFCTGVTITTAITGVTLSAANVGPNQDTSRYGPATLFFDQSAGTLQYRGPGDITYGDAVDISSDGTYTIYSDNPSKRVTVVVVAASLPVSDVETHVTYTSTSKEFDGIPELMSPSQIRDSDGAVGDALSFPIMDELIDSVKVTENLFFVGNAAIRRKFLALLRSAGGNTADTYAIEGINRPVPVYQGIPFLKNDWIPSDESKGAASTLSSLYLVSLDPEEGFRFNVGQRGSAMDVDTDPMSTRVLGVKLRVIGELEGKELHRTRISWYGTTRLGSELAMARASEIVTA